MARCSDRGNVHYECADEKACKWRVTEPEREDRAKAKEFKNLDPEAQLEARFGLKRDELVKLNDYGIAFRNGCINWYHPETDTFYQTSFIGDGCRQRDPQFFEYEFSEAIEMIRLHGEEVLKLHKESPTWTPRTSTFFEEDVFIDEKGDLGLFDDV